MARGKSYAKPGNRFVTGERMKVLNENVTYNTPLLPSSFPRIHLSISPGKRVNSYFPGALTFDTWENPKIPCLPLSIYHLYLFIYKKKKERKKKGKGERKKRKLLEFPPPRICRCTLPDIFIRERTRNARYIPYPYPDSTKQRTRARVRARERREKKGERE